MASLRMGSQSWAFDTAAGMFDDGVNGTDNVHLIHGVGGEFDNKTGIARRFPTVELHKTCLLKLPSDQEKKVKKLTNFF